MALQALNSTSEGGVPSQELDFIHICGRPATPALSVEVSSNIWL